MAKYKIAWMPGDGIGIEVMEAARIVLDKVKAGCGISSCRYWLGILEN